MVVQVPLAVLQHVARQISRIPDNFELHVEIQRLLAKRQKMAEGKLGVNMAFAEALAFGTLLRRYSCDKQWEHNLYDQSDER